MKSLTCSVMCFALSLTAVSLSGLSSGMASELWVLPGALADKRLTALEKEVTTLHEKALRSKKAWTEGDLRGSLSSRHASLADAFGKAKKPEDRVRLWGELALIYADLAWKERIDPLLDRIAEVDAEAAARLGHFAESDHVFARVVGADASYADASVRLSEAALAGYGKVFGDLQVSKVPGKKIRVVIHVDAGHAKPRLYFHPSPSYHSELRYEIPDAKYLTLEGQQRIVYGFCHELGHMVAMWGEYGKVEDDKHAWAHYAGSLIVEEVYDRLGDEPWPGWTAFQRRASGKARLDGQIAGRVPDRSSYEGTLALFSTVGDEFGTAIYAKCIDWLREKRRVRYLGRVPYLWMDDLRDALIAVGPKEKRSRVAEIFAATSSS